MLETKQKKTVKMKHLFKNVNHGIVLIDEQCSDSPQKIESDIQLAWCTMIGFAGQLKGSVYNTTLIGHVRNHQAQMLSSEGHVNSKSM